MLMNRLFIFSFFALVFSASESAALSVQSLGEAFSYNNVARDFTASAPADLEKTPQPQTEAVDNTPVDYETIAEKLLSQTGPEKVYINFCKHTAQNVQGKTKQTFFVILPEDEGTKWVMNAKCADIISTQKDGNRRILELRLTKSGRENIFIDNIDPSAKTVKQSRILRLWVQE